MSAKGRKRHGPGEIVRKLRDAKAMLTAGKELAAVLQALELSEAMYHRWRNQYGGTKSEEAKRLKLLEDENRRLKQFVADQALDIQTLKHVASGNPRGGSGPRSTLYFAACSCFLRSNGALHRPFAKACGGDRASRTVRGLRAKGVRGRGATAEFASARSEDEVG